jgi:hypothetical protein
MSWQEVAGDQSGHPASYVACLPSCYEQLVERRTLKDPPICAWIVSAMPAIGGSVGFMRAPKLYGVCHRCALVRA